MSNVTEKLTPNLQLNLAIDFPSEEIQNIQQSLAQQEIYLSHAEITLIIKRGLKEIGDRFETNLWSEIQIGLLFDSYQESVQQFNQRVSLNKP